MSPARGRISRLHVHSDDVGAAGDGDEPRVVSECAREQVCLMSPVLWRTELTASVRRVSCSAGLSMQTIVAHEADAQCVELDTQGSGWNRRGACQRR